MYRIVITALLAALSFLSLSACNKGKQNEQAVEQGLREYLRTRAGIDLNSMDIKVTGVSFRKDEADATVTFQAKGTTNPGSSMRMKYAMELKDGKWVVKGRSSSSEHGGADETALPPNHPPAGGAAPGGSRQ